MAIPASHLVEVLPSVSHGGSAQLELNGLVLADDPTLPANLVLSLASAAEAAERLGNDSALAAYAAVYFNSYDKKTASPPALKVCRRLLEPACAWLRGSRLVAGLAELRQVTNGGLCLSLDNTAYSLSGLDLSGASSLSDLAVILQTALRNAGNDGAIVSYHSGFGALQISSGLAGAQSEISFATAPALGTDLAGLLRLREADNAIRSIGAEAMSPAEQLDAILAQTQNWVSFTTAYEAEADEALALAAWANAHYGWLYVAWSSAPDLPNPLVNTDLASQLRDSGLANTCIIYGSLEYALFLMGMLASVAWQRNNGTITAAFKSQSGLAAWVADETAAQALEAKNCNYMGRFASRSADFVFFYPGLLSSSDYGFIDPYLNAVWLNNRLQAALLDGLAASGRVPYNQQGYTRIKTWLMEPINLARHNGVIEAGVSLSASQQSEANRLADRDIAHELWTHGYHVQVLDPGSTVRSRRGSPLINVWYTYAGSVHKVSVAATALL